MIRAHQRIWLQRRKQRGFSWTCYERFGWFFTVIIFVFGIVAVALYLNHDTSILGLAMIIFSTISIVIFGVLVTLKLRQKPEESSTNSLEDLSSLQEEQNRFEPPTASSRL